ncbi:hypothetical protein HPB47_013369 [Ixodes persulcatus]|uniref:Uncharacterized protein n=1 Tax=Ixodes persulcatus TaxID=34615 RepID=A0AC60QZH2_IXOPE|nr:hypothetical protein HPB47_013369 [Ixodes persulcatus]
MDRLTSSRASAFVLWCVLLVKHGAGVQPECDFGEFYRLYSPAITTLNFTVTGEFNSPNVLQRDCHTMKEVTQRVETLLEGCSADNNEKLKKQMRGLQLTRDSLCGSELKRDLDLWQDCFDAKVFAECKKNVEERLNKLRQDGALDATGDHMLRYPSFNAGADCPEEAERARKAVENYINTLMDAMMCRRPTGVEVWNKCLNQEALENCRSKIPKSTPNFDSQADMHAEFCRVRGETLKCELAAGSNCPASARAAEKALYDLRAFELDLLRCPRPKIDGYGGGGFSTTPAILVTLSALCVALLPLKQTLLRDLN